MTGEELLLEASRSLESLRDLRLRALLRDLVSDEGRVGAAELLGVSYRTLVRAVESDELSGRMSDALERHLLLGGGSAAARQRERVEALEQRMEALERKGQGGLDEVRGAVEAGFKALREEQAHAVRGLERRLAKLESRRGDAGAAEEASAVERPAVRAAFRREYPDLVTLEPEPGEEDVYGDATPLIAEWRKVRDKFTAAKGRRLARAMAEERMRELELEMIGERRLTLPPSTWPWDESRRRDEVWLRERALDRVRVERARAQVRQWLRRVLTLGLWWE